MCRGILVSALALLLLVSGCKPIPGAGPVKIWADPALKAALDKLEPAFHHHHPSGWQVEYKESGDILKLSAEDHPDVVLTVEPTAQKLYGGGIMDESTGRTFGGDMLTVVTPRSKPLGLDKVGDLVMTLFKGIGMGSEATSEGYYADQALIADGAKKRIKDQIKTYKTLDELVAAVGSGSVDFGMVFASTATQHKELAIATTVPEDLYEDIKYVAVASKESAKRHGVMELLRLLGEDEATQKLLGAYGYVDRKTALEETK